MMGKLLLITALLAVASWANAQDASLFEARMEETRSRLNLTEDQAEQLKPILEAHFEAQLAILSKYGLDGENRENRPDMDIQTLRALRGELDESKTGTATRLKEILSNAQLAEFEKIQTEREKRIREGFLAKQAEDIGVKLGLTGEQAGQLTPVLAEHFDAQIAVLEKHGISIGGSGERKRLRLRALRALRNDLDDVSESTAKRLSGILSRAQLDQFKQIQQAQRERFREIIRAAGQD